MTSYFVTQLSPGLNIKTGFYDRLLLEGAREPVGYLERAKAELAGHCQFVTEKELYRRVSRKSEGQGSEIILSISASAARAQLEEDFPMAKLWVYR